MVGICLSLLPSLNPNIPPLLSPSSQLTNPSINQSPTHSSSTHSTPPPAPAADQATVPDTCPAPAHHVPWSGPRAHYPSSSHRPRASVHVLLRALRGPARGPWSRGLWWRGCSVGIGVLWLRHRPWVRRGWWWGWGRRWWGGGRAGGRGGLMWTFCFLRGWVLCIRGCVFVCWRELSVSGVIQFGRAFAWWVRTVYWARRYSLQDYECKRAYYYGIKGVSILRTLQKSKERQKERLSGWRMDEREKWARVEEGREGKGDSRPNDKQASKNIPLYRMVRVTHGPNFGEGLLKAEPERPDSQDSTDRHRSLPVIGLIARQRWKKPRLFFGKKKVHFLAYKR